MQSSRRYLVQTLMTEWQINTREDNLTLLEALSLRVPAAPRGAGAGRGVAGAGADSTVVRHARRPGDRFHFTPAQIFQLSALITEFSTSTAASKSGYSTG